MFDKNVNIGSHNRAGRDQFITVYTNAPDYQQLLADIAETEEDLRDIPADKISRRLQKGEKLAALRKQLEDFKENVFRLHELFTRIPINNERLRLAKAHFDKGEFREADAVLKAEEINAEVAQLKAEKTAVKDRLAAIDQGLADKANEFLLKARLSLLNPAVAGESRFKRTEQLFEQALAAVRTAKVLHEYARFLCEHNAFSRAEPLCQEALMQLYTHGKSNPEVFLANVAATLNNLANLHKALSKYDAAEEEYEEALKAYRTLAEADQKAFLPSVAMTLNNLAVLHSQREKYAPAMAEYQEALKIRRSLAMANPEAFRSDVAATLHDLASLHYQTEGYGLAEEEYQEALNIRRSLARVNPEAFRSDVAMTLHNLAGLHYQTKEYESALAEFEEALQLYRSLAAANPEAFLPYLAGTLNNLAVLNKKTQVYGTALKDFKEALKIRRSLAETEPKAFLPDVAGTLNNLSIYYLEDVPDRAQSVAYAEEARSILVPLCAKMPHLQKYLDLAERLLADNGAL